MTVENTPIKGLLLIRPDVFSDSRGYFFESFNQKRYIEAGINSPLVQDNISKSVKGTIRGLHYQAPPFEQGKLCSVIYGKVLDVALDIRFGSPTFGKHFAMELSEENKLQLWIPPGFAHGFSVLSDTAVFSYKCSALYNKDAERSIIYNDPDLNITWNTESPIVSSKDLMAKSFKDIEKDFSY